MTIFYIFLALLVLFLFSPSPLILIILLFIDIKNSGVKIENKKYKKDFEDEFNDNTMNKL